MTVQDSTLDRSTPRSALPDPGTARYRWAITAVFFLNGLTLASYIIRLPSLKTEHHLSNGQLGLLGTVFGASALITMQFVGPLVARFGSAAVIRMTLIAMPVVLIGVGLDRGTAVFVVAVTVIGAVHGTLDVSMNAHAIAVERVRRRPIMSGCHAAWSISAVAASIIGAAFVHGGTAPGPHFVIIAAVVIVAGLATAPFLMPASADQRTSVAADAPQQALGAGAPGTVESGTVDDSAGDPVGGRGRSGRWARWRTGWPRALVLLGLTGTLLLVCDGAALAWSAIFLHDNRGATLTVAATAVTAYTASQTAGRLIGDRLTLRFGAARIFQVGGLIGVIGFVVAVVSRQPLVAVAGFAVFGLGTSNLMPLTFSAAGHAGGDGPGAATFVSRFTTFTYSGILLGPALIGWVAQGIGLTWTLAALIPVLAVVALRPPLPPGSTDPRD